MATRPGTLTLDDPLLRDDPAATHEAPFQVVLHNDDYNAAHFVVDCLMQVFGHPEPLAVKIMLEAHERGKAVAEVEGETPARRHGDALASLGLSVTIERL